MANVRDAIDASWDRLTPAEAKAAGLTVVYGYLSWDTSKNIPSSLIAGYHKAGIGVYCGWESQAGRPLGGAPFGTIDGTEAGRQMRAHFANVGYAPKNTLSIPYSMDQNVTAAQFPTILAYLKAAEAASGNFYAGCYGEYALIDWLYSNGIQHGLFQTYAWSGGQFSPHADLYQWLNGQKVAGHSVDYDQVIDAVQLGAWWPPGHPLDTAQEDPLAGYTLDQIAQAVWEYSIAESTAQGAPSHHTGTYLVWGHRAADATNKGLPAVLSKVNAVTEVVAGANGIGDRVAALQAQIAAVQSSVNVQIDVAALAAQIAAALPPADVAAIAEALLSQLPAPLSAAVQQQLASASITFGKVAG